MANREQVKITLKDLEDPPWKRCTRSRWLHWLAMPAGMPLPGPPAVSKPSHHGLPCPRWSRPSGHGVVSCAAWQCQEGLQHQSSMRLVQGWILCSGWATAHGLGSLWSSQSEHLQASDNEKVIWLLFLLLQLLSYFFCSLTFIKNNPSYSKSQLSLRSPSPCPGNLNSLLTLLPGSFPPETAHSVHLPALPTSAGFQCQSLSRGCVQSAPSLSSPTLPVPFSCAPVSSAVFFLHPTFTSTIPLVYNPNILVLDLQPLTVVIAFGGFK